MIVIHQLVVDATYEKFCFFLYYLVTLLMVWRLILFFTMTQSSHCWWYDGWFDFYRGTIVLDRYVIFIVSILRVLWPRTALHWHRACYLVWGTISLGVVPFSLGELHKQWFRGHRPGMLPRGAGLLEIVRVSTYIVLLLFPFSGLVVCFFVFKRCSDEPEIKIHYHSVLAMGIALS